MNIISFLWPKERKTLNEFLIHYISVLLKSNSLTLKNDTDTTFSSSEWMIIREELLIHRLALLIIELIVFVPEQNTNTAFEALGYALASCLLSSGKPEIYVEDILNRVFSLCNSYKEAIDQEWNDKRLSNYNQLMRNTFIISNCFARLASKKLESTKDSNYKRVVLLSFASQLCKNDLKALNKLKRRVNIVI